MKIYLDDNRTDNVLAALLTKGGHHVLRPSDVGLAGARDARHLEHAIANGMQILTADHQDFRDLHQLVLTSGGVHAGILLVRFDNNPNKDMKPKHIVAAITSLENAGLSLSNQVVVLNQWR